MDKQNVEGFTASAPVACDVAEAARHLGVSSSTLWRMLRDGQLRKVKIRGRTMIRVSDLAALLEADASAAA